ncbi:PREDICTED: autophagy-related protein 13a-like [Ipomoea nil]|uniref:autophagy-related protein 13a-like n=1 Tax=Ipomoea nil TaxID=35883 RepID=UPI000901FB27|nr:PREDICTED: autophagy-related protein 13a-like [Ipomoea nil]XP_019149738.1 PREDICTED: autophagy-related protein 13a-like [Ipomoea nil]
MDLHGNPQGEYGRFEQILSQFLLKSLHIILDSRVPVPSIRSYGHTREVKKSDKWFNIVLGDRPAALDNLNFWHRNLMEPMIIDIILVQDKANSSAKQYSGTTLGDTFTETVIERWVVQYEHPRSLPPQVGDSSYKKTYKKLIILLRSLYSMTRLLPAYKAFRKLSSSQSCDFDLNYKVSSFSVPFSRAEEPLIKHYSFIPVDAQHGCFSLSLTYRENLSDFNLETSACFPPEIITDYVGSPLADPMRSFPSTSSEKGVRATSYPLRRSQSSASGPFQRPHSWTSGLHKGPSLAQNEQSLGSPPLYRSPYDLSSPPVNVHGRRISNSRFPTHHRTISSEDYQLSPPFSASPSPSLSPPTHVSHGNPALSRLSSETSPVNIPHPMASRNSGFPSPNFSDPNRHSLPPQSPRSIKHDSSHHEFPTGIRSLKKSDSTRAGESSSGTANLGLKVLRDAKDDSGRFSGLHSSSGSPRIGFSRSSSRLSFPDDLDDYDFSCPFVVDDVDSQASQNLNAKKDSESPSQAFLGTRKSQDAAVGAVIQMLKTAPPLRQDSSCYSPSSVKIDPEGEIGTSSGFSAPRKISDAMEDLRAYKELKDLLLSKSATQSVRKADY